MDNLVPTTGILAKVGTKIERKELLDVMSGQLGIRGDDQSNPTVISVLASAASKHLNYGWVPNIHMHALSFNVKNKKTGEYEKVFQLVDGEKAWRDTAERYTREHNIIWFEQFQEMPQKELVSIAQQMRYPIKKEYTPAGIYARIIRADKAAAAVPFKDTEFAYSPPWEPGIWTGFRTVGANYTVDDGLPVGRTAEQTARRRALKAAIMAQFTPIPLDGRTEQERLQQMIDEFRSEVHNNNRYSMPVIEKAPIYEVEGVPFATEA